MGTEILSKEEVANMRSWFAIGKWVIGSANLCDSHESMRAEVERLTKESRGFSDLYDSTFKAQMIHMRGESAAIAAKEKAEGELAAYVQTSGDLCPACGWRGIRGDDGCAFCSFDAKGQPAGAEVLRLRQACLREQENTADAEADSAALRAVLTEVLYSQALPWAGQAECYMVLDIVRPDTSARATALAASPCDVKVECEGCERMRGALDGLLATVGQLNDAEFHSGGSDTHAVYVARDAVSAAVNIARAALAAPNGGSCDPTLPPGVVPGPTGATTGRLEDDLAAAHATVERLTRELDEMQSAERCPFGETRACAKEAAEERTRLRLDLAAAVKERSDARRMYCESEARIADEHGCPETDARCIANETWPDSADVLFPKEVGT